MHNHLLLPHHRIEMPTQNWKSLAIMVASSILVFHVPFAADLQHLQAQQVTISVPSHSVSEGFFEYQGTSWTLVGPNGFARFGPAQPQVSPLPVFEGSPPALGFYYDGSRTRGEFYGYWSQGIQRSHQSITLSQTLTDGIYGSLACQSLRPFVIGFRPVFALSPPGVPPSPWLSEQVAAPTVAPILAEKRELLAQQQTHKQAPSLRQQSPSQDEGEPPLILAAPNAKAPQKKAVDAEAGQLVSGSSAERVVMSVDEARKIRQAELDRNNQIAQTYLDLSKSAMMSGRQEQAKIYLRLAEQYASGLIREKCLKLQREVETPER
ncbi:MAG: hypothetical protein ACUVQR_02765 [Thermogutta sp.]